MGNTIIEKLTEFASSFYKIDIAEAKKKIEEMEEQKRIIKELWS